MMCSQMVRSGRLAEHGASLARGAALDLEVLRFPDHFHAGWRHRQALSFAIAPGPPLSSFAASKQARLDTKEGNDIGSLRHTPGPADQSRGGRCKAIDLAAHPPPRFLFAWDPAAKSARSTGICALKKPFRVRSGNLS